MHVDGERSSPKHGSNLAGKCPPPPQAAGHPTLRDGSTSNGTSATQGVQKDGGPQDGGDAFVNQVKLGRVVVIMPGGILLPLLIRLRAVGIGIVVAMQAHRRAPSGAGISGRVDG